MNRTLWKNHDEALALAKYRKGNFLILAALAAVLALSAKTLRAQTYTNAYYDINGATSGTGGSGTWASSSTNTVWSLNSAGTASTFGVTSGSYGTAGASGGYIFNFGGTAGTVTESSAFTVGGVNFLASGYIMTNSAARTWTADSANSVFYITNNANAIFTGSTWNFNSLSLTGGAGATITLSNATAATTTVSFGTGSTSGGKTNSVDTVISGAGTVYLGTTSSQGFTQAGKITNNSSGLLILTNGANGAMTVSGGISNNGAMVVANTSSSTGGLTLTGGISGVGAVTLSNSSTGFLTNSGAISGSGSVSLLSAGSGAIVNQGAISGTGIVTLNNSSSGFLTNSGTIANSTTVFMTNSSSGTLNSAGAISGSGSVVLNNSAGGKLLLTTANSYAGGTTLSATNSGGYVGLSDAGALGSGSVTISGTGTNYLRAAGNNLNITNSMAINAGSTLRLAATNTGHRSTWSGQFSGAGGIYYAYSDNGLYLTSTNSSFGGGVNIGSSGSLFVTSLGMAGSNSSIGTNGTILLTSDGGSSGAGAIQWLGTNNEISDKIFSLSMVSTSGSQGVKIYAGDNGQGGTNVTLTLNGNINSTTSSNKVVTLGAFNGNTLVVNGLINQTAGYQNSVVINANSNNGTVILANTNNSFGGGITINSAASSTNILQVAQIGNSGANSALGTNGTIHIGGSSVTGFNILKYTGNGETSDKVINLQGTLGSATLDQSGSGNLKFTSTMTATGVGNKTLTLQGSTSGTGEVASAISDLNGNVISLNKDGTGTWTLSGANTYTGGTTVGAGTLATSGNERLSDTGTVAISNAATLRLGGHETVSSVAGATGSTLDLQNYTLTIGGGAVGFTNTALTIGSGSVVKNGTNLIYLNNSGNTYSGGFTLNGGEVAYTSSGTYGVGGITSTVFGTGTLTINGGTIRSSSDTSGRNIANSIILNGDVQFGAAGSAAGITITNIAGGTTTLTKDVTITSFAAVDYKQAINGAAYRLTYNGTNYYNSSNSLNQFSLQASNNIAGLTVSAGTVGYKNRNSFGNGDLILANGVVVGQDGTINNTGLTGNDRTDRAIANNILLSGNVTFGLGGTANYLGGNMDLGGATRTITLGNTTYQYGAVTNGGLVIDNGTGAGSRLFGLFASNSYSGGTVVRTNAILAVGHDQALGSANLVFTNTTGVGAATLRASTLSSAASQLRTITNNIQLASGMNVTVETVSSVQGESGVSTSVNLDTTLAGTISGSGSLTKTNSNKLTLTGNNTYSGSTTVNAGTLEVASGASIGSSATTVNSATLTVNGTGGDVTVNSGGTVKGSGTVSALSIASGGTLAVGNSPGTLTASSVIWNGGGTYAWEINNFLGSAGSAYDFLNVSGGLTISASSENKFIIDVISLLASNNTAGEASNFNANSNYSFAIATAAGGISGFDASYFDIQTSGFANPFTGSWSVAQSGSSVNLLYTSATAIPEPSTSGLFLVGLGIVAAIRRRKIS